MDVTLGIKPPSGNCYGGSVPMHMLEQTMPTDWLLTGAPVPDYVEPIDRLSFQCGMAAAVFVARAERVLNSPLPTTPLAPDTYGDLFDSADLHTTVETFAADTASLLWSVPHTWSLADDRYRESMTRFVREHPAETDMRKCDNWLAQVIITGTAEPITRQVAEYISLRFRGHSAGSIGTALAEALMRTANE